MSSRNLSVHPRPQRLSALLQGLVAVDGDNDPEIAGLETDSRRVVPGDLFFACAGGRTHGAEYIDDAVRAGARAVLYEPDARVRAPTADRVPSGVPLMGIADLGRRLGVIAARFYEDPSRDMLVIGITGTNGKTSVCHYLAQALLKDGAPCGVIGTLGYGVYGALRPGTYTTPDAVTLQEELAALRAGGIRRVVMEVSSHALEQERTRGVAFDGAIFTNLTRDHLDYHGDLTAYARAKQKLFLVPGLSYAAINEDDPFGRELLAGLARPVVGVSYGLGEGAGSTAGVRYVRACVARRDLSGMELRIRSSWGEGALHTALLGEFNASNLLAVLAMLLLMELPLEEALKRLEGLRAVPGRMERFEGAAGTRPLVIVDYAHTPDALAQALRTLRPHCAGRLWCVFGCGGDRDRGKRPLMGAVAARDADRVVVTSDNPRHEDPQEIIGQILAGIERADAVACVPDRAAALRQAIESARPGDIVLVAGKGHEDYQQIGDERLPFSDRDQVRRLLEETA
ncbi:MAG: UDP-N-acetylmuramoyl-L-alanyl-D-glutamate--2,6-diaminopimelate ligase [Gammaproteobacteria bacterium]|nr:UDP-N-acetylmuramoyl-L-alanyl-D-glutamate--2,6-diaminopimelate ligase [Gammaproteobacteria bacterium]